MMYIENIFICISIPLFLSLIFIRGDMRKYMLFICIGIGMTYIFCRGFLKVTGTIGLLGASSAFHAIFNLLVSADGIWKWIGYLFPSVMIVLVIIGQHLLIKMNKYLM